MMALTSDAKRHNSTAAPRIAILLLTSLLSSRFGWLTAWKCHASTQRKSPVEPLSPARNFPGRNSRHRWASQNC